VWRERDRERERQRRRRQRVPAKKVAKLLLVKL
jgi:hypothetical protein